MIGWPFPGCDPLPGLPAPRTRKHPWSAAEIALLVEMYPHCHTADVAAWLGVTVHTVYSAASWRGLHKTAEYLASDTAARIQRGNQHPAMVASRFQPGHARSWNKGTKGVSGLHPNTRRAQFKPGRRPEEARNYQPIGTVRVNVDGMLERKVTDDQSIAPVRRWVSVARLVWAEQVGPIPDGHLVVFKPGMRTADVALITPARLECITRAENARRNHPATKSPEYFRLVQLKGAITRQVNRIAHEHEQQRTA